MLYCLCVCVCAAARNTVRQCQAARQRGVAAEQRGEEVALHHVGRLARQQCWQLQAHPDLAEPDKERPRRIWQHTAAVRRTLVLVLVLGLVLGLRSSARTRPHRHVEQHLACADALEIELDAVLGTQRMHAQRALYQRTARSKQSLRALRV